MPILSALAAPFVPKNSQVSGEYYLLKYQILNLLESTAMPNSALFSEIKSEFHKLKFQLDSFSNHAGSSNSPAVISTTSSPPSVLTSRQMKRQLRAAAFKNRKSSVSPESSIIRKSTQIVRKRPADPKYNNFFQYLDLVDSGVIRIPETSPISPKSNFNTTLFPSIRKTCASSPISLWLPRRPPVSLLPKILESNHAKSRSFVLPTIRQPTWSLAWPRNYSTVFKKNSSQYFS